MIKIRISRLIIVMEPPVKKLTFPLLTLTSCSK